MAWTKRYYHYDGVGSTQLLTDENGNVTDNYCNTAFGSPVDTGAANPTTNPFRFGGQQGYYLDADTGNYYARMRSYSSGLARWLSEDSVPADINLYRYCGNEPVLYIDPSGQFKCVPKYAGKTGSLDTSKKSLEYHHWPQASAPAVPWPPQPYLKTVVFNLGGTVTDSHLTFSAIAVASMSIPQILNATSTLNVGIVCTCHEEGSVEAGTIKNWCTADVSGWGLKELSTIKPGPVKRFPVDPPAPPFSLGKYREAGSTIALARWGGPPDKTTPPLFLAQTTLVAFAAVEGDSVTVQIDSTFQGGIQGQNGAFFTKSKTDVFKWKCTKKPGKNDPHADPERPTPEPLPKPTPEPQ